MSFFILACLSFFSTIFLIMLSVQLIRMEKMIIDTTELVEAQVEVLYGKF